MENNYNRKEEIIKQLEELLGNENPSEAYAKAKLLSRRWKKAREEEESFYDKELSDRFNSIMDQLAEKAGDIAVSVEERKQEIINKAKQVLDAASFRKGNEEMNQLLEQWKQAGRSNKEKDDELWQQFSEIRKEFFNKIIEVVTLLGGDQRDVF